MLHLRYDFENSDNCDTVGKTLRYYRIHKGYSTRELAEMAGVVPATITLYENDKHPIKYKTAVLLADILEIDRKLLLDDYTTFIDYPCNVLLQEIREKLSFNQSQIAQEIGVAQSAYSAWERATRTPCRQEYEKILPIINRAHIHI
jgi:transcriptional regulator with XRE-family HTH domain